MKFQEAMDYIERRLMVRRKSWLPEEFIFYCTPPITFGVMVRKNINYSCKCFTDSVKLPPLKSDFMELNIKLKPFLCKKTKDDEFIFYVSNSDDLLAEDWEII